MIEMDMKRSRFIKSTKPRFTFLKLIFVVFCQFLTLQGLYGNFGPQVKPTQGGIWPKPKFEERFNFSFVLDPKDFQFQIVGESCAILVKAVERYKTLIKMGVKYGKVDATLEKPQEKDGTLDVEPNRVSGIVGGIRGTLFKETSPTLPSLRVYLKNPCEEYPSEEMDESYNLTLIHTSSAAMFKNQLSADSIWGLLRGLETFSQILVPNKGGHTYTLDGVVIIDSPRFPHRGLLLDTSRHFFPVSEILRMLDGMAFSKMNVFHWHIVDDQAFPYQSVEYPDLSLKGAYHPNLAVYKPIDVKIVIEFARERGIRVIPEFDTPGHTLSWGQSVDGLLAKCSSTDEYGPIDPTNTQNYVFLEKLFTEVAALFNDRYIHLGGDEVDIKCWEDNEAIAKFMVDKNMGRNFTLLETYYFTQVLNFTDKLNLKPLVWQEVLDFGVSLDPKTVIHAWKFDNIATIKPIVSRGYKALYSSCWYLDALHKTWRDYYRCDILDFQGSPQEKALVIGGEACMWGEMVDETNVSPRIWPRACATAERLWTNGEVEPSLNTAARIEEHSCRLKRRGVLSAPPNGPGFCPFLYL